MSNSSLVSYTKISPYKGSRNGHKIDTISIHCVVGQCGVEALGSVFRTKEASANYGIGYDGRIGMYVEEKDRSWCTSSTANDARAVTIECASDAYHPYAVNAKVYATLIELLADICKRNGIKKLVWSTNKTDRVNHKNGCNMTVHRDYANKSCPGDYLYNRHGEIADAVNKKLMEDEEMVRWKTIDEIPNALHRHECSQCHPDEARGQAFPIPDSNLCLQYRSGSDRRHFSHDGYANCCGSPTQRSH